MTRPGAEPAGKPTSILLVSERDWFVSALKAVLEPEGFGLTRVRSARIAARDAGLIDPEIVIIDEGLPDLEASALTATLSSGALRSSVPILVYSPDTWQESAQAAVMGAGAWGVIREPIRSKLVVAKLRRLLEIKQLIESTEEGVLSDPKTGFLNLAGLLRMTEVLAASAGRTKTRLACAVLGPTTPRGRFAAERGRTALTDLCLPNLRDSDVCGWVGGEDLGIVAIDTNAAGLAVLVRRLTDLANGSRWNGEEIQISAGIVEIGPAGWTSAAQESRPGPVASKIASLSRLAAAQRALRDARGAGGGIRIAEGV
ncbi:MAG: hypothetical protein ABFS14_07895 [Gemmatimonadota bacterium]